VAAAGGALPSGKGRSAWTSTTATARLPKGEDWVVALAAAGWANQTS
jgi:hypothetical protein